LDGLGTLVFAGGIGENAPTVRVIRRDEELMIARSVTRLLSLGTPKEG
jgi:acetate kinase